MWVCVSVCVCDHAVRSLRRRIVAILKYTQTTQASQLCDVDGREKVGDISSIGRNTQGVRIITLGDDDSLASVARIPAEVMEDDDAPATDTPSAEPDVE